MTTTQKHLSQRVKYLSVFDILSTLTRMGIDRLNAGSCRPALQSPAVLDVKPAIKDVGCVYFSGFPIHKYIDMYIKQSN